LFLSGAWSRIKWLLLKHRQLVAREGGTHPMQAFFIIRKREQFLFQAKVFFSGVR
jgi:hypothetical protein